jgi:hypothetical protein
LIVHKQRASACKRFHVVSAVVDSEARATVKKNYGAFTGSNFSIEQAYAVDAAKIAFRDWAIL